MSLAASAHKRMRKKRGNKGGPLSPSSASSPSSNGMMASPIIVSPRNASPIVSPQNVAAVKQAMKHEEKAATTAFHKNGNANARSSPLIASLNKSQYHVVVSADPPTTAMQQPQQPYHPRPRPPPLPAVNSRRGGDHGGGGDGINCLDSSGDYVVDSHSQWQQQQQPQQRGISPSQQYHQQQQQQQRGMSPSPQYHHGPQTLHPSPGQRQQQQPSPTMGSTMSMSPYPQQQQQQQQHNQAHNNNNNDQSSESAARYQGNYTNYLPTTTTNTTNNPRNLRHPAGRPSKPRRRYDSFTDAPSDDENENEREMMESSVAFDPSFAPSPLTLPNGGQPGAGMSSGIHQGVHASHRASPYFQQDFHQNDATFQNDAANFPSQKFKNLLVAPSNNGGGMHDNGMQTNNVHGNNNNMNTVRDKKSPRDTISLATIHGNNHFVYDPEREDYSQQDSISSAHENTLVQPPVPPVVVDVAHPPILVGEPTPPKDDEHHQPHAPNSYDFEYHTEKDEGSTTFDGHDAAFADNSMMAESIDLAMPLKQSRRFNQLANNSSVVGHPPSDSSCTSDLVCLNDERTIDSERALYGTPAKKKEGHGVSKPKKSRRRGGRKNKSRVIIDHDVVVIDEATAAAAEDDDDGSLGSGGSGSSGGNRAAMSRGGDDMVVITSRAPGGGGGGRSDPRYAIHHTEYQEEEETDVSCASGTQQGSINTSKMRDIATHARKFVSATESRDDAVSQLAGGGLMQPPSQLPALPQTPSKASNENGTRRRPIMADNGNASVSTSDTRFFSPQRIGLSKSWDSQDHASTPSKAPSFSRNMWDDDQVQGGGLQQQQQQGRFARASKSWDEEHGNSENKSDWQPYNDGEDSIAAWGTWGDQTASLFGGTAGGDTAATDAAHVDGNAFGNERGAFGNPGGGGGGGSSDKENLFDREHFEVQGQYPHQVSNSSANAKALAEWDNAELGLVALAEWDKAEAEWRENVPVVDDVSVANSAAAGEDLKDLPAAGSVTVPTPLPQSVQRMQIPPPALLSPQKQQRQQPKASETMTKAHPWSSTEPEMDFADFEIQRPSSEDGPGHGIFDSVSIENNPEDVGFSASPLSDDDDDDEDSIFEFDTKQKQDAAAAAHQAMATQQQDQSTANIENPTDIFHKLKSGLKQADKTKNRALGNIQGIESDGSNDRSEVTNDETRAQEEAVLMKVQQSSSASETAGGALPAPVGSQEPKKKRTISFAADDYNTIHTYIAQEASSIESMDDDHKYDDDETDDGSHLGASTDGTNMTEENKATVSLSEKIGESSSLSVGDNKSKQNQQRSRSMSPGGGSEGGGASENEESDADTYGDSTIGDSTYKSGQESEDGRTKGEEEGEDLGFFEQVDNAVNMLQASFGGLFGVAATAAAASSSSQPEDKSKESNSRNVSASAAASAGGGTTAGGGESTRSLVTEDEEKSIETDEDNETYGESTLQSTQHTGTRTDGSEYDWLGYMRSMIFPNAGGDGGETVGSEGIGTKYSDTYDGESTFQEDEDSYLLQQALAAARAIHHVQGVEYDETQEINVLTDIKFVVVTVSLPLGLLFQEHEIGVWVSRVVPDGNGAKKGVQHGDQLAAINGNSSVHTTIDEVASSISSTPKDMGVELTFLRYVGPLRPVPGSIIQEGFEVTDTSVSPKRKPPQTKSKRSLFSKRKSSAKMNSSTPPSSPGISTRRFGSRSPKNTNSPSRPQASSTLPNNNNTSSSGASSSAPSMPSLAVAKPSTKKKKKSLGKLLPFKKKS